MSQDIPHGASTASSSVRREKTKDQLTEAAFRVFGKIGVAAASIEMICEEAGFTRGAFYSNFESKEQLLLDVVQKNMNESVTQLEEALTDYTKNYQKREESEHGVVISPEEISAIIDQIVPIQFSEVHWFIVFTEFRLVGLRDPEIGTILAETERKFIAQITDVLVTALHTLGLRITIKHETATRLFMHIYQNAILEALLNNATPIDEQARKLAMREIPDLVEAIIQPAYPEPEG